MAPVHGRRPDAALERLLEEVRRFSDGAAQGDDITALVLRFAGS
jgi:serine phosphatase RsbU (regulator of sigma subunit)